LVLGPLLSNVTQVTFRGVVISVSQLQENSFETNPQHMKSH